MPDGWPLLTSAQTDADLAAEICVDGVEGIVACYDGLDGSESWRLALPHRAAALGIADVAGDPEPELLVGTIEDSDEAGPFVYALGANSGILRWRTAEIENPSFFLFDFVRGGEVDGDSNAEVVALASSYGWLLVFDGPTGTLEHGPFELGAASGMRRVGMAPARSAARRCSRPAR